MTSIGKFNSDLSNSFCKNPGWVCSSDGARRLIVVEPPTTNILYVSSSLILEISEPLKP